MRVNLQHTMFFMILLLPGLKTSAQVLDMDNASSRSDSAKKWNVSVQAGADFSSEKKIFDWDTKADITRFIKGNHLISAVFVNSFIGSAGSDLQNTGFVHLRLRDNDTRKISPEYFTQFQWDNLRGMVNRYLAGINIRFRIRETRSMDLYTGAGLMYEQEKWNFDGVDSAKLPAAHPTVIVSKLVKLNVYIKTSLKLFKTTEFTFTTYFQAKPDKNIIHPRVAGFMQWKIPVSKKFSVNLAMDGIYDAAPIVPINFFYYSYITGFSLII